MIPKSVSTFQGTGRNLEASKSYNPPILPDNILRSCQSQSGYGLAKNLNGIFIGKVRKLSDQQLCGNWSWEETFLLQMQVELVRYVVEHIQF